MKSKRTFSVNLIFLLAVNLLVKPFYLFGIEVGVQNEVGAEAYGLYYAMFNFTFLFNVILDMGINNFQKIKVAQHEASGLQNMASLLPMKLGLSVVYVLVTLVSAAILGFEGKYWYFIGWLMINHILSVFILLFRANLAGLHLFARDSVLSIMDRALLIGFVGYALWFGTDTFTIERFVLFQTTSYAIALVVAALLTPRGFKLSFNLKMMLAMAKKTWPFALLILLMTAYNKLDGIMLERLASNGVEEAGIYAQAYRLLDAGNSFAFLYAGLLLPMFARLVQSRESAAELKSLVDQAARFLIAPAGVVALLALFYAKEMMQFLYVEHAEQSAQSLFWLMGSFVFIAASYVYGTLITASGELKWLNWIAFGTVLLNIALNFWLIPTLGAEGAAMTSFVSLAVMTIAQLVFAAIRFELTMKSWMLKSALLWLFVLIAAYITGLFNLPWTSEIVVVSALAIAVFLVFVVDLRNIISPNLTEK